MPLKHYPHLILRKMVTLSSGCTCCNMSYLTVDNSYRGMALYGDSFFHFNNLTMLMHNNGRYAIETRANTTTITNSYFEGGNSDGINLADGGNLIISDSVFTTMEFGVILNNAGQWTADISSSSFTNLHRVGIRAYGLHSNLFLHNNTMFGNYQHVYCTLYEGSMYKLLNNDFGPQRTSRTTAVYVDSNGKDSEIHITGNSFIGETNAGLRINAQSSATGGVMAIEGNVFEDMNDIIPFQLQLSGRRSAHVTKNVFRNNENINGPAGMEITFNSYNDISSYEHWIQLNEFSDSTGKYIVQVVQSYDTARTQLNIFGNLFTNNYASDSILHTNVWTGSVTKCIFSNPQSTYDLKVSFTFEHILAAINNWWGFADPVTIAGRIYDASDDASIGNVSFVPALMTPEIACDNVANCSGNGICLRPDFCECFGEF